MKRNLFIKKIICLIIILNILSMNLTSFMQVFAQKEDNIDNVTRIADKSTVDDYKEIISNSTHGTANNGRVWTDKSVYSKDDSNEVTLDNKFNIQFDDDFLNVFSALGTSQQVLAKEIAPLDVVLLLDVSTSMTTSGTEYKDSAEKVIEEANKLIKELMGKSEANTKVSKGNRISVIVYAGGSQVLLPLNHYDTLEGDNYISIEDCIEKNGKFFATVSTNVKVEGETFENRTSKPMFADATYLQGALYQGMHMLATEPDTIYTNPKTEAKLNRTPVLIVLTDGATNTVGATETGDSEISIDWWNPLSWVTEGDANSEAILPTYYNDGTNDYRNFVPYPNGNPFYISCSGGKTSPLYKAIAPRTLGTLLTAGYMKNWIEDNYSKKAVNNEKINLYGFGIGYNIGTGNDNISVQLNSTMNPKEYFTSENDDEQIQKAYTALENYIKDDGQTQTMQFDNYKWINHNITGSWDFNHPSDDNKKYDVKSIEDVYYIDKYFTADDGNIQEKFQELFSTILTTTLINTFTPIKGENCLGTEDTLTYVDPIGDYMEVKDVSDLLLFGQRYDIVEFEGTSEERTIENPEKTYKYYKAVGENGEDLPISNPSYNSEEEYKLSDIKIWKEKNKTGDSKEELHIEIPNKLIPIKVDKISLDLEKSVEKFETNNGTDLALPIRILYTVGVNNEILNNKKIDFSKISPEYVVKNMNEEGISFFSNKFEEAIYDENSKSTLGDAVVSFSPSSENSFYVYQENATIYKNSSAGEGLLEECGGTVTLTDEVKDMSEINKDETYYYIIEVYVPQNEVDAPKGKLLKYATAQKGEVFYENDNITYLTYYDTKLDDEVEAKGENTVVATKIGENRIIDLKKLSLNKEQNVTGTASTYYAPSYARIENEQAINNYLGNNGRIIIDQKLLGSIKVTKLGDNNEPLSGATFAIYAREDIISNEEIIYKKGEEIGRKTTGEDGIVEFNNLPIGSYEIKELQAPEGYTLLEETAKFDVTESKYIFEFTVKNHKIIELDTTLAPGTIPQTGEKVNLLFIAITIDVIALGIFSYTKYRKLKF